jgi:hypothetical protein
MITQEQWEQCKEEFGEDAYKRLIRIKDVLQSNETVEYLLSKGYGNTLGFQANNRLFAHDVEIYGKNAYLMWDGTLNITKIKIPIIDNDIVYECLNGHIKSQLYRKTSAVLPFDLTRAKKGDPIEIYNAFYNTWITPDTIKIELLDDLEVVIYFEYKGVGGLIVDGNDNEARMKYPPKLKK